MIGGRSCALLAITQVAVRTVITKIFFVRSTLRSPDLLRLACRISAWLRCNALNYEMFFLVLGPQFVIFVGMRSDPRNGKDAAVALQISRIPYVWCVRFHLRPCLLPCSIDFCQRREK